MSPGKAASQAGHAFLDSFLTSPPDLAAAYRQDGLGTKVVLTAPDEAAVRQIHAVALSLGIPTALIVDSGHVMPPHFDGKEIVTAVGIGPARRCEVASITQDLQAMR